MMRRKQSEAIKNKRDNNKIQQPKNSTDDSYLQNTAAVIPH